MLTRTTHRPATKHNRLFGPGPRMHLNACVGRNGGPANFGRYARGYFAAGAMLVKCLQEQSMEVDVVVYPLVMNYRHGVEDMLKHLAATVSFLSTDSVEVCYTHKLTDNWAIAKKYLPRIEVPQDEIDEADSILKDLVEIDPTGETFRYPQSRDGRKHLDETSLINIEVFAKGIGRLAEFLDFCVSWTEQHLDWKAEMERAYG